MGTFLVTINPTPEELFPEYRQNLDKNTKTQVIHNS